MNLPTLRTARLDLRPIEASDLPRLQEIWDHPDIRRYLFDDEPVTIERAREVVDIYAAARAERLGLWSIRLRGDANVLGCAGLLTADAAAEYDPALAGQVEPVVALAPSAWHRGYAHEALECIVEYAFSELALDDLAAVSDVPNEASARMLERSGFEPRSECPGPRWRIRTWSLTRDHYEAAKSVAMPREETGRSR